MNLGPIRIAVAVGLTFVAGYVDAVGWLSLDRVFTAQMSGNLVLLAVHLAAGESTHAVLQFIALAAFFLGLVISGSMIEVGMRHRVERILVAALAVEFVMLAIFAIAGDHLLAASPGIGDRASIGWPVYAAIAVVAFAMGTQNTSLRMAGIVSVFTTHMTGPLSQLSEELIVCGFSLLQPRLRQQAHGGFVAANLRERHPQAFDNILRSTAMLIGFFIGAVAGAELPKTVGLCAAMFVPLLLIAAIGLLDWIVPLTQFPSPPEKE